MIKLDRSDIALALIAITCGGFVLFVAAGVVPMQTANDTPMWVVGLIGVMFVIAGIMIFLRNHSRALDFFAARHERYARKSDVWLGFDNVFWRFPVRVETLFRTWP